MGSAVINEAAGTPALDLWQPLQFCVPVAFHSPETKGTVLSSSACNNAVLPLIPQIKEVFF